MISLRSLFVSAVAASALLLPTAAFAQQAPPASAAPGQPSWQGQRHHHGGMMGKFRDLNLTDQQHAQIKQLVRQFRQAHRGSRPDARSRQQLFGEIMKVLTPQQQTQLKQHMDQMRQMRQQRGGWSPAPGSSPQP